MIGMGSAGSEDPIMATLKVLADPVTYQVKYEELMKQTVVARQATEDSIKARTEAEAVIARAAKASTDLADARKAFEYDSAKQNATMTSRESDVAKREDDCSAKEANLAKREADLAAAIAQANADIEAARKAFEADTVKQSGALDRRKASLDEDAAKIQKQLDARATSLAEREGALERDNQAVQAMKLNYDGKIAKLRSVIAD